MPRAGDGDLRLRVVRRLALQRLVHFWSRKGILVCVRLQFVACGVNNISSKLDNTTSWGLREEREFW